MKRVKLFRLHCNYIYCKLYCKEIFVLRAISCNLYNINNIPDLSNFAVAYGDVYGLRNVGIMVTRFIRLIVNTVCLHTTATASKIAFYLHVAQSIG